MAKKKTVYTVLYGRSTDELQDVVNKTLSEGGTLHGGVLAAVGGGYIQAVTKEVKE